MIRFPDYDRSILSIAASVLKHYGVADCPHKTLKEFDDILDKNYENVIVMLFDGMGVDAINTHLAEDSFLRTHLVCPVSSVFPSTTTAATTSILSGCSPLEHGWLGWDLYFKELDENVAVFKNTLQRNGEKAAEYNVAQRYIPCESIFQKIEKANDNVQTYFVSPFGNEPAFTFHEIRKQVLRLARKKGEKYIYTYSPEPDNTMHKYGVGSARVKRKIKKINKTVEKLCKKLKNSAVVVTADHGLVDSKRDFIEEHSSIWKMLKRPASIEPRALSFFVKDEYKKVFKEEFEKEFPGKFIVLTKQEVYDRHLFGYGAAHPRVDAFLGDFLAVAVSDLLLFNYRENDRFVAGHAGFDTRKMTVPFIAIETS